MNPLSSAVGSMEGSAATLTFESLAKTYQNFYLPQTAVFFGGKAFKNKDNYVLDDFSIELTCGFEASIASFRIYNVYEAEESSFKYSEIKSQVCLGNTLDIVMGYMGVGRTVFHGFVAGLDFHFERLGLPYIEVTGMDVKGIMMANSYSQQIAAASYSSAVRQIMERTVYSNIVQGMNLRIESTPDASGGSGALGGMGGTDSSSPITIEMVAESDYEFVVKAAKRYNFEFFCDKTTVYFRPAKSDTTPQAELSVGGGISDFNVGYSITGLVGSVETRSVDAGTGKLMKSSKKLTASLDSKARALVKSAQKVYIDPTIQSQQDADARAESLYETMRYQLGSFEATCVGIPDLSPGRFLSVKGMGDPADNSFYISTVTHQFSSEEGFRTMLEGKAASIGADEMGGLGNAAGSLGGII